MEYKVWEWWPEEHRSFLRHSCDDLNEAIARADFYGDFTEVWQEDENGDRDIVYISLKIRRFPAMKTIKLTEHMDWIESALWIEKNKKSMIECKNGLTIDFSELCFVHSNIVGLIIHIRSERKKKNLKTVIIPPQGPLMKKIFSKILEVKK